jgi:hypothetical protein
MVEVVHADRARLREPRLDAVPGRMLEVEREPQRRVERAEQELECALVPRLLERDADRPQPVSELSDARLERVEAAQTVAGELRRELEPVRRLLGPAPELLLRGQPVAGCVQLDRGQALRVEGEKAGGIEPGGVEAGPPAGIRPARGADADVYGAVRSFATNAS